MPIFHYQDIALFYEIFGKGDPLLLIHGFMGTGTSEFPALLPRLAEKYQVIAADLRGYGQSPPKPRRYGIDFYQQDAKDLAALLEHLNLSNVMVMGYSDGGEVALWLPLLTPDRIRGVITWGATGHFSPIIKPAILGMSNLYWRTPQVDALHGAEHIPTMTKHWVHSMLKIIDAGGDITYSQAAQITCPVLMCNGTLDDLNPVANATAMVDALPNGQLMVYDKIGHAIHQEAPEQFWRDTQTFIQSI